MNRMACRVGAAILAAGTLAAAAWGRAGSPGTRATLSALADLADLVPVGRMPTGAMRLVPRPLAPPQPAGNPAGLLLFYDRLQDAASETLDGGDTASQP